jgi:hypothetical protein
VAGEILLADADVLIDYRDSDLEILSLVSRHIGPVHVLTQVLAQVHGLTAARCGVLRLRVIGAETSELVEAPHHANRIGFHDSLCLVVARRRGWTVVSNDGALLRACRELSVLHRRGLRLMVELVGGGLMPRRRALAAARAMRDANPRITDALLDEFEARLG